MGQQARVCRNNTEVAVTEGTGIVILYGTKIVEWNEKKIVLNSGGHQTVTTKARMMQTSNQYDLGYTVYQRAGRWFVSYQGRIEPFRDGMILYRKG